MQCTSVLVSSQGVRYLVAYKRHEASFFIFKKKYFHSFRTPICNEELDYAQGIDLSTRNTFAIANLSCVKFYDSESFEITEEIHHCFRNEKSCQIFDQIGRNLSINHRDKKALDIIRGSVEIGVKDLFNNPFGTSEFQ